ncbi:hypothetical protein ACFJIX_06415 [Roseateles sp. UC29_93]|uniref:hypothetical protein n=1 Tax=Roseateles sp. UC29_93 TaxID=3350177 RepID=UPI00366F0FC0
MQLQHTSGGADGTHAQTAHERQRQPGEFAAGAMQQGQRVGVVVRRGARATASAKRPIEPRRAALSPPYMKARVVGQSAPPSSSKRCCASRESFQAPGDSSSRRQTSASASRAIHWPPPSSPSSGPRPPARCSVPASSMKAAIAPVPA